LPYAVEMYFDVEGDKRIRYLWRILYEKNLSSYMYVSGSRPHISLSVLNSINVSEFSQKLQKFTEEINPFEINFGSIGVFPGEEPVLFLAPTVTEELLKIHNEFNNTFSYFKNEMWNYYLPGKWIPHCTLATDFGKKDLPMAMKYILDNFEPMNVVIEEIGIVKFRPIKDLVSFKLKK